MSIETHESVWRFQGLPCILRCRQNQDGIYYTLTGGVFRSCHYASLPVDHWKAARYAVGKAHHALVQGEDSDSLDPVIETGRIVRQTFEEAISNLPAYMKQIDESPSHMVTVNVVQEDDGDYAEWYAWIRDYDAQEYGVADYGKGLVAVEDDPVSVGLESARDAFEAGCLP